MSCFGLLSLSLAVIVLIGRSACGLSHDFIERGVAPAVRRPDEVLHHDFAELRPEHGIAGGAGQDALIEWDRAAAQPALIE